MTSDQQRRVISDIYTVRFTLTSKKKVIILTPLWNQDKQKCALKCSKVFYQLRKNVSIHKKQTYTHNQLSVLFIHPKVLHTYKKMNAINPTFEVYVIKLQDS